MLSCAFFAPFKRSRLLPTHIFTFENRTDLSSVAGVFAYLWFFALLKLFPFPFGKALVLLSTKRCREYTPTMSYNR